jgi:hypothetical protein
MNGWVEAPLQKRGLGCFARGCLILVVFGIVLALACFAGFYWGRHHHSAIVQAIYWLGKTRSIAEAPAPVPEFAASDEQIQAVQERWQDFEQKSRAGQPAEIELTADDLNSWIAANRRTRWKAFASIEGNRLRLQLSVPLAEFFSWSPYYFNDDIQIELKGTESLDHPQLNAIIVNNQTVPRNILSWKYRSKRLAGYLAEYRDNYGVRTIEVREGKLILRSRTD